MIGERMRLRTRSSLLALSAIAGAGAVWMNWQGRPNDIGTAEIPVIDGRVWFNVAQPLNLVGLRGRPVVLEFWATWCGPCRKMIPKLNGLQRRYAKKGLVIIGLTTDKAKTVSSFVRRYNITYPVCAEQLLTSNPSVKSIPWAVIITPEGAVAWEGDAGSLTGPLDRVMESISSSAQTQVVFPGLTVGLGEERAHSVTYDEAYLTLLTDLLTKRLANVSVEDFSELFQFYWANLPANGEPGDTDLRHAACAVLVELWQEPRLRARPDLRQAIQGEFISRLDAHDPDWGNRSMLARLAPSVLDRDHAGTIEAIRRALQAESNPIAKARFGDALERLDSTLKPVPIPISRYSDAEKRYTDSVRSVSSHVLGLPKDLRPFQQYREFIDKQLSTTNVDAALVKQLLHDHAAHPGNMASDLLIRGCILDSLSTIARPGTLSKEAGQALEEGVYRIFVASDADWKLRLKQVLALEAQKLRYLDRQTVISTIEAKLTEEPVRLVRANLEYLESKLHGPARN